MRALALSFTLGSLAALLWFGCGGGDDTGAASSASTASGSGSGAGLPCGDLPDGGAGPQPPAPRTFGAPCASMADCDSAMCLSYCTKQCAGAGDCPPGPEWTCAPYNNSPNICQCMRSGDEICDGQDNDCNGVVDDGATCSQAGFTCQEGKCQCEPSRRCCDECVDKETDVNHCGSCDIKCPKGAGCAAAKCACPGKTPMVCGDACADLDDDPKNCGACGHVCDDGCSSGACLPSVVVSNVQDPGWMAVIGGDVYWTELDLKKAPVAGGAAQSVFTFPVTAVPARGIAIDSNTLYYPDGQKLTIAKVTLPGGAPQVIATQIGADRLAVDAQTLYFLGGLNDKGVQEVPTSGGMVTTLAGMQGQFLPDLAVGGGDVYWLVRGDVGSKNGAVRKVPTLGGAVVDLVTQETPMGIALGPTDVYFTYYEDQLTTGLRSVPRAGGAVTTIFSGPIGGALAIDATDAFSQGINSIQRIPLKGGAPVELTKGVQAQSDLIAIDADYVYWANKAMHQILRIKKH